MELLKIKEKVEEDTQFDDEKLKLHREIKRRVALETIVTALEVQIVELEVNFKFNTNA